MKKIVITYTLLTTVALGIMMSSCSKAGGSQFVGTWGAQQGNLTIEKNGDLYMVNDDKAHAPYAWCPSGASYQNGQLTCSSGTVIGYDTKRDQLLLTVGPFHESVPRVK